MSDHTCVVCGIPHADSYVARLTWISHVSIHPSGVTSESMEITVAKKPKDNDVFVCICCIRGIKRIPFSKLPEIDVPF